VADDDYITLRDGKKVLRPRFNPRDSRSPKTKERDSSPEFIKKKPTENKAPMKA
jgi:hypothetical protein